ncbi:hypothetical protein CHU92_03590 [Flavobacterium cyanobacteriorum]|uniref:Uncharacterized protein n=2 Tax=Flavobacterium cyanobacteriorum TaxID=2022802 RepID=A0A255ZRA9_9FLAO|nr:hypothetical protein CHU92_03590 [Flavobacterium cyanobacteriorum]
MFAFADNDFFKANENTFKSEKWLYYDTLNLDNPECQQLVVASCGGWVQILDKDGKPVAKELYISNAKTAKDCNAGFAEFIGQIEGKYSPADYTLRSNVSWN